MVNSLGSVVSSMQVNVALTVPFVPVDEIRLGLLTWKHSTYLVSSQQIKSHYYISECNTFLSLIHDRYGVSVFPGEHTSEVLVWGFYFFMIITSEVAILLYFTKACFGLQLLDLQYLLKSFGLFLI